MRCEPRWSDKMSTRNEAYNPLLKSYVDSDKVNAVSEGAENLYVRLIAQSDDEGRYSADPQWVLAKLYTHRMFKGLGIAEIAERIAELWTVDLIRLYEVDGKKFLQIVDVFRTHRKDVKKKVLYPKPLTEPVTYAGRTRNEHVTHPLRTRAEHVTLEPEPTPDPEPEQDPKQTPTPASPSAASPPSPSKASPVDRSEDVRRVFEHYRARFPKRFPRVHSDLKEWGLVRDRIVKDGFTVDELCAAIDGNGRSPYHQGQNDQKRAYDSLELIVRDTKHVQDFMAVPARAGPVLSKKTQATFNAINNLLAQEFGDDDQHEETDEDGSR
jgi:hypothetical protein